MMNLNLTGADAIYDLLRSITHPDFKSNLALLADATAQNLAAAEALTKANMESVWFGRLAEMEAQLEQREKDLRLGNARLEDKAEALSKL
jgi:hypothetical protein